MKNFGRLILLLLSIGVAAYALAFLDLRVKGILLGKGDLVHSIAYRTLFYFHVGFGTLALIAGAPQFFPKWRNRRLQWHRQAGKMYVIACLLSGTAGLIIAGFASGGSATKMGFALLAISWLFTTGKAYIHIRSGRVEQHQIWMIRSFALTLAAVSLRMYLPLMRVGGLDFSTAYRIVSWACWIPNLLIAQWIIFRMEHKIGVRSVLH